MDVLDVIAAGGEFSKVSGIAYRNSEGKIIKNPPREACDVARLPWLTGVRLMSVAMWGPNGCWEWEKKRRGGAFFNACQHGQRMCFQVFVLSLRILG
jgi:hypothetical protein